MLPQPWFLHLHLNTRLIVSKSNCPVHCWVSYHLYHTVKAPSAPNRTAVEYCNSGVFASPKPEIFPVLLLFLRFVTLALSGRKSQCLPNNYPIIRREVSSLNIKKYLVLRAHLTLGRVVVEGYGCNGGLLRCSLNEHDSLHCRTPSKAEVNRFTGVLGK